MCPSLALGCSIGERGSGHTWGTCAFLSDSCGAGVLTVCGLLGYSKLYFLCRKSFLAWGWVSVLGTQALYKWKHVRTAKGENLQGKAAGVGLGCVCMCVTRWNGRPAELKISGASGI